MNVWTDAQTARPASGQSSLYGVIATSPRGTDGFGYDPLFIPEGEERTFAEMDASEKNAISHRRRAADELLKVLETSFI